MDFRTFQVARMWCWWNLQDTSAHVQTFPPSFTNKWVFKSFLFWRIVQAGKKQQQKNDTTTLN